MAWNETRIGLKWICVTMVAGLGLFLILLCYTLGHFTSAHGRMSLAGKDWSGRMRRSDSFYVFPFSSNLSSPSFENQMIEDESDTEAAGIQEKLVVRGQVVILECLERDLNHVIVRKSKVKETHSDAAVRWFQTNTEVKPDLRVTWSVTGRLRISHAVSGDSGIWRCRKDGYFRRPLRLIVTIPPERPLLVYGGAQLAEGARLTTRSRNSLTLHCVVEGGNPAPTIEWFLNENEITANSSMRSEWRGPEEQFASVSNVTLARVKKEHHNASVVCRVVHPALSRPHTTHLKLNIEYPPDFRLRRWPVWGSPLRDGASVSLLCHVDANPPSLPLWIKEVDGKEEEVGSPGGWFNLTSASSDNRGWYKCATEHILGRFSSHSVYINVLHDDSEGLITQQYPLRHRDNPPPLKSTPRNCHPIPVENNDAVNRFIWKTGIKIKVMNRTHAALEGGPAMLTAHLCGIPISPDHVTWIPPSRDNTLFPGKSFGRWTAFNLSSPDSQKCVLSNLHIVPVYGAQDAGAWVILVANSHSAHAALVRLNVSAAAKSLAAATAETNKGLHMNVKKHMWLLSLLVIFYH